MRNAWIPCGFVAFFVAGALSAQTARRPAPAEPGITRDQADAILNELREIRKALERLERPSPAPGPEAPQRAKLKLEGGFFLGSKDAPLTMVEYTDAQCPFCRQFHITAFEEIKKQYIDTGKLRFYSRDLPLDFHSNAFRAAEAGRCAGDQGQFWKMRDVLIANAAKLAPDDITGYATGLNLNMTAFKACLETGKHKKSVQKDMAEAASLNISGTPSFLVGKTTPDGVDGLLVVGALPFPAFEAKFKEIEGGR